MKALSVKQLWAFLIARGEKTIETRLWNTDYRGDLLIVASKTPDMYAMMDRGFDQTEFVYGRALCMCRLVNVRPMTVVDEERAGCEWYGGAFAWELEDIREVNPFPVRGQLKLYDIDDEFIRRSMVRE